MVTGASWVHFKPRKTKISQKKSLTPFFHQALHIYSCENKGFPPSKIYLAKVASIHQIETTISDYNSKQTFHDIEWKKFTRVEKKLHRWWEGKFTSSFNIV